MSKGGGRLSRLFPKLFRSDKDKTVDGELKGPVCMVLFLDDTEKRVTYKTNWKGQVLFDLVCDQVNIFEKDYFGLRFVDISGQTHWVENGKSLSSQLKGCSTPHKFYFCVKFYAADPCKLKEEITRYMFFLQVKRDILQGRLPVTFEEAAELCAYAVQSELGDFDPRIHTPGYVSEFNFVPNQTEEMESRIAAMHRRCVGATPLMAEHRFLEKTKWLEMYGVDLHPVQGESNVEYFLGLTPTGIVVYKHKTKVASYFWPRITKASHKSKIFMIKVKDKNNDENVYAFELSSKSACKHLWKCCVEHHTFFRVTQAKDKETRPTKVLRSLSNSSHRGRSERQAAAVNEQGGRQEPSVCRVASRRQQRRVNSESQLNADQLYGNSEGGLITLMGQPQPVRAPRHRSLPELQGKESPRSVKSAPWESKYDYGLYTSGHESPAEHTHHSRRSRAVSGSDSESGISQRKKYFPSRKESDNESDGSASRRRRREADSDSGSEVSFTHSGHGKRQNTGVLKDHNRNDMPILYPFHDKDKNKNGSIPSLHSAPVGEFKQQRRRRRRSKSPGNSKQYPQELKQHIEFNLVDTEGMTEEQLQDIAYTKVETKNNLFRVKYSPKFRHKIWASRRKSFGDADSSPKNGGTLGRQDSRNTDPAGAYGGYTTHGGSSMDERPPAYNTLHPSSSGNPSSRENGNNYNSPSTDYIAQSGYESRGSHISSSSSRHHHHRNQYQHGQQPQPHDHHNHPLPSSPYHVITSPTSKKQQHGKENIDQSDSDTLVSYVHSVRSYASRGAKSDVVRCRKKTPERQGRFNSKSVTDIRKIPSSEQSCTNVGDNGGGRDSLSKYGLSSNEIENRNMDRYSHDQHRKAVDGEYNGGSRQRQSESYDHYHHQQQRQYYNNHNSHSSQPLQSSINNNHLHNASAQSFSNHRLSAPSLAHHPSASSSNSFSPAPLAASALDASPLPPPTPYQAISSPPYPKQPVINSHSYHVTATHPNYLANPTRRLPASSNSSRNPTDTTDRNPRPHSQDYTTVRSEKDHRNQHRHSQAFSNSSNPQQSYHNPVYFNNNNNTRNSKGVSTPSNFNSNNSYHSGNQSGSELNYNDGRSANHSRYTNNNNNNNNNNNSSSSQPQRQSTLSGGNSSRTREYGRQTPSRNLYHDFKDSAAMPVESPASPSRSVGVTANSSQQNTPPRNRPLSYHQQHHQSDPHSSLHSQPPRQQTTPPRSDYSQHSNSQQHHHQQQQVPPPSSKSQQQQQPGQYISQGHTPPRMQQTPQQTSLYRQQQQQQQQKTPPRSQYSPQGQLRGGSSIRGQGSDYRQPPMSSPHNSHHQQQFHSHSPSPHHYNTASATTTTTTIAPNPPADSGLHTRGHSGQSASSSGYSGSHSLSYQSNPGTPSGFSPRQSRPGNPNASYNSQHPNSNLAYRQGSNNEMMAQGQRSTQNHSPPQAYTSTPRRVYGSDLVTEL